MLIIEGNVFKKNKDININKKILIFENLNFLTSDSDEPKISPLNRIEDWCIYNEINVNKI